MKLSFVSFIAGYLIFAVVAGIAGLLLSRQLGEPNGLIRTITEGPGFPGSPLQEATVVPDVSLSFLEDDPDLPRRFFSVRWTGFAYVSHGDGVDFYGGADDRLIVRVDGNTVLERSPETGVRTISRHVPLRAGVHEFEVEYQQHGGGYRLNLEWAPAGGAPRPLDAGNLFPLEPTDAQLRTIRRLAALQTVVVALWLLPLVVMATVVARPHLGRAVTTSLVVIRRHPVAASAAVVFLVALVVRLVYLFITADYPAFVWVDPDEYTRKARLLTESGTWHWTIEAARYQGDYFKAPLYPVFLSMFTQRPDYL